MRMSDSHWAHFVDLMQHVEEVTGVGIDQANLETTLFRGTGGIFVRGKMAAGTALSDEQFRDRVSNQGVPLLGAACAGPQNRTGGFEESTFALKIMDLRMAPHAMFILFAYDVFADGRRVLHISEGLTLDDDPQYSKHKSGQITEAMRDLANVSPSYVPLVTNLVRSFDCKDNEATKTAQGSAMAELSLLFS